MEVILFSPQIPQNTGNIIRTCRVTGSKLTLIKPLGFEITEKALRRAHLDYAGEVNLSIAASFEEALRQGSGPLMFLSTKGSQSFYEAPIPPNTRLIFGNETHGLPEEIMQEYQNALFRLPMLDNVRCLNLSNAVAICLYEVLRQNQFAFSRKDEVR